MKLLGILLLVVFLSNTSNAQRISSTDSKFLLAKEDSLKTVALKIVQGRNASDRFFADSAFTRIFVRALRTKNSFYYPFDSIVNISKLYAPDSSFKIFTWQLMINENTIRQHGAIQMKTDDGSFKVFPLLDSICANLSKGLNLFLPGSDKISSILTIQSVLSPCSKCPTTSNTLHVSPPSLAVVHSEDRPSNIVYSTIGVRSRTSIDLMIEKFTLLF